MTTKTNTDQHLINAYLQRNPVPAYRQHAQTKPRTGRQSWLNAVVHGIRG